MKPIELILATVGSLTDREREQIAHALRIAPLSPCERNGHKLRAVETILPLLFGPKRTKLTCTVCGHTIVR